MSIFSRTSALSSLLVMASAGVSAQALLDSVGQDLRGNGFHLYSATASSGYSSILNAFDFSGTNQRLGSDIAAWASLSTGFTRIGSRSRVSVAYTPSYSGRFRYSGLQSLNQNLVVDAMRSIHPNLNLFGSAQADDSTAEQFVFSQAGVQNALTQQLPDSSVAVPGSSFIQLPALQASLYGARVLSLSASTGFNYNTSTRLSFSGSANMAETQARADESRPASVLIPRTRLRQGSLSVSWALTPKLHVSADGRTSFVRSSFAEYQTSVTSLSLTRKVGRRWVVYGGGGVGFFRTMNAGPKLPDGKSFVGTGSFAYRTQQHTLSMTVERNAGDVQGLASSSTVSFLGSWSWKQRGFGWSAFAFGGRQMLRGSLFGSVDGWQGSAGVTRTLGRQTQVGFTYAYMLNSLPLRTVASSLSGNSVRASITWIPFLKEAPPLTGTGQANDK
jgi:hypothetical protein